MAGLNHLADIYEKKGKEFLESILNKEVIINEKMDGAFFGAQRNCQGGGFKFFKRNTELTGVDRVLSSYYNPALRHFDQMSQDQLEKLPCNYYFGMEYFTSPTAQTIQYDRLPKNHLILSYIHVMDEEGEPSQTIQDKADLDKWADVLDIERPPIIFQGKLTDEQKEKILDFVYTPLDELVGKFKTKSFTKYIINVLNPSLTSSFLRDTADKDIEGIVFRFYEPHQDDSVFLAKLVDPVFQARAKQKAKTRVEAPKTDDYIWIMTADLMNFIETYSQADLDKIKPSGDTFDSRYIQIVNSIFKDFVKKYGSKYRGLEISTPEFLDKPEFDVNRNLISDQEVISVIDSDKTLKELYRVFLNTFRKKKVRVSSAMFTKTMKETLNSQIGKIQAAAENKINEAFFPTFNQFFGDPDDATDFFTNYEASKNKKKEVEVTVYLDKFQPLSQEHEKIAANLKGKYSSPCFLIAYRPENGGRRYPLSSKTLGSSIDRLAKDSTHIEGGGVISQVSIEDLIKCVGDGYSIKAIATNPDFLPDLIIDLNRINKRAPYAKIPSQIKLVEVPKIDLEEPVINAIKNQDFASYKNIVSKPLHSEFYNMNKELEESLNEALSIEELEKKKEELVDLLIDSPYNEAIYKKIEKLLKRMVKDSTKDLFEIIENVKNFKELTKTIIAVIDELDQLDEVYSYLENPTLSFPEVVESPTGNLKELFKKTGLQENLYDALFNVTGSVGNIYIGRGEVLLAIIVKDAVNAPTRVKGDIQIGKDSVEIKESGETFRLTGQSGTGMGADAGDYIRQAFIDLFKKAEVEPPAYLSNETSFSPTASAQPRKTFFSQGITAAVQASSREEVIEILAEGFNKIYKKYKDDLLQIFDSAIDESGNFINQVYLEGVLKIELDRYLSEGVYFMAINKSGQYVLINGKVTPDQLKYFKVTAANNIRPKSTASDSLLGVDVDFSTISPASTQE